MDLQNKSHGRIHPTERLPLCSPAAGERTASTRRSPAEAQRPLPAAGADPARSPRRCPAAPAAAPRRRPPSPARAARLRPRLPLRPLRRAGGGSTPAPRRPPAAASAPSRRRAPGEEEPPSPAGPDRRHVATCGPARPGTARGQHGWAAPGRPPSAHLRPSP